MTTVLTRRGQFGHRYAPREDKREKVRVLLPQAKDVHGYQKLEEAREDPAGGLEGAGSADTPTQAPSLQN